jgi:uncharacterized protein
MLGLSDAQHMHALQWVCTSPPLLSSAALAHAQCTDRPLSIHQWTPNESRQLEAWCAGVDPEALALALGPEPKPTEPSLRLGRYAERLVAFLLSRGPLHELIAAHVPLRVEPVMQDRTTSGELDFLLRDRTGQHWHWELAIKLFLFDPPGDPMSPPDVAQPAHFIGPDRKDSLALKLDKLVGRQLVQPIPSLFGSGPWRSALFALGWMFYPLGKAPPDAPMLHSDHAKGWWLEANTLDALPDAHYVILPRLRWLAPARLQPDDRVLQKAQLLTQWHVLKTQKATLIARLDTATGYEIERYFVRPVIAP